MKQEVSYRKQIARQHTFGSTDLSTIVGSQKKLVPEDPLLVSNGVVDSTLPVTTSSVTLRNLVVTWASVTGNEKCGAGVSP